MSVNDPLVDRYKTHSQTHYVAMNRDDMDMKKESKSGIPFFRKRLHERLRDFNTIGSRTAILSDVFFFMLHLQWWQLAIAISLTYLFVCIVWGSFLYAAASGFDPRPADWSDCLFLAASVMTAQGSAPYVAVGPGARVALSTLGMLSILATACVTGVVFARFSQPIARVVWSNCATISSFNGKPALIVRVANERANICIRARFALSVAMVETTKEGKVMRRFYDLKLLRENVMVWALAWTMIHIIDESSPLFGLSPEWVQQGRDIEIFGIVWTTDVTYNDKIHSWTSWLPRDLRFNQSFKDLVTVTDTWATLDLTQISETQAVDEEHRVDFEKKSD
eukprot:TRINITY_DN6896_c0_g1_i3.p1 TRINITY_DN6896_c0_g1~~TRINITY_DN6896_c0_g1_i3.p1  ORF type:complete len:336 (+),score=91.26 TRINITY_DN6896_c0_g1_i3:82-1089(+)